MYWFPTFMDPDKVERSYARTGHFDPSVNRTNFEIITESKVTKILLNDGAATGVSFEQKTANSTSVISVQANKEVIIAAGAIHSPQILQLSGIGPSSLLEAAGIETIVDLPGVGQNFQDHPMVFTSYTRMFPSSLIWAKERGTDAHASIVQNFTVHPNPTDMFGNQNFSAWAQELWTANKTGKPTMVWDNTDSYFLIKFKTERDLQAHIR